MIDSEKVQAFHDEGYIFPVPILSDSEFGELSAWFKDNYEAIKRSHYRHVLRADGFILDFIQRTEIVETAKTIYDEDVWLLASRAFPKSPSTLALTEYYAWHQDAATWGINPPLTLSIWCALTESTEENGCIQVIPKSHTGEILSYSTDQAAPGNLLCINQEADRDEIDESKMVGMELKAGECSIHDSRILHHSGPNYTDKARYGISWIFAPVSAQVGKSWGAQRL